MTHDVQAAVVVRLALSGHRLCVFREDGQWDVWLNTEVQDFDGLCLTGGHATAQEAREEAARILRVAAEALAGPEPPA